jgi:hypothetical protein
MALSIIRLGDPTSHGGKVMCASVTHVIGGIGIARAGDGVACPIAGHGVNPIVEGASTFLIDGRMVAVPAWTGPRPRVFLHEGNWYRIYCRLQLRHDFVLRGRSWDQAPHRERLGGHFF